MKKILPLFKPYILQILLLTFFVIIQVMTDLALPDYLARIINEGILLEDNQAILQLGFQMVGIALIGAVATIIVGYFAAKVATGVAKDMRSSIYGKIMDFSLTDIDRFSTSSLITRSTNDVQQIQMVIFMFLRIVISAPIMGIGAIIKAYDTAPDMAWIIALAVTIVISVIIVLMVFAIPKFKLMQQLVDKLNLVSRENLTGLRVIRAFNTQKDEQKKFDGVNKDLVDVGKFTNRLMSFLQPFLFLVLNLTTLAIVWFGAQLIDEGNLEIGNMLAFMQYAIQAIMAFLMMTMIVVFMSRAAVSIQRIGELLGSATSIKDPEKAKHFPEDGKGIVQFKEVSFSYGNSQEPVLCNITFTANPGEVTAFIGSTGSGKSTLVDLIPRFYDVTYGEILIDGVNIKDVSQEELRSRIGYVPQKGFLFSGSIESNLKYGKENASKKDLDKAVEVSQAEEFISKYKSGYKHPVTQGGTNVSGGQKQRLSIARAVVKDADIYIFDDSFSALDLVTEKKLRNALSREIERSTVMVVAQRISTIMNAEKIIVLQDGEIVGQGTHEELIQSCVVYKEIALSQLSEEELNLDKQEEK